MNWKRLVASIPLGMLMGVFCVLGLSQRIQGITIYPSSSNYLWGAWYGRVILGVMIGLADDLIFIKLKSRFPNVILRGAILGLFVSLGFGLLQQRVDIPYFVAGAVFGILIDLGSTYLVKKRDS